MFIACHSNRVEILEKLLKVENIDLSATAVKLFFPLCDFIHSLFAQCQVGPVYNVRFNEFDKRIQKAILACCKTKNAACLQLLLAAGAEYPSVFVSIF